MLYFRKVCVLEGVPHTNTVTKPQQITEHKSTAIQNPTFALLCNNWSAEKVKVAKTWSVLRKPIPVTKW